MPPAGLSPFRGGRGRDRPAAACPPDCRPAAGEAGGFNAVQKLFTDRGPGFALTQQMSDVDVRPDQRQGLEPFDQRVSVSIL